METHCASGTAFSLGARPCSDVQASASERAAYLRTCASQKCVNCARALSVGRKPSARASDVRARCRAGWSRSVPYGNPLRQRDGFLPRCTAVLRRVSCGLQTRSLLAYVHKPNGANSARSLSLRRKHSTRAFDVRAPRRAGWSRSVPCESPLRQRDGRFPRCTALLRPASCGLQTRSLLAYVRKSKSANRARSLDDHECNIDPGTPLQ